MKPLIKTQKSKLASHFIAVAAISLISATVLPNSASAAVKISKKAITLTEGSSATLHITGTNKTVKWKSSKKSVATVSKYGIVKAKKAGNATITAKVGKKSFKCKITVNAPVHDITEEVKDTFDPSKALASIEYQTSNVTKSSDTGVIGIFTNNYDQAVSLSVDCLFYDENGNMIGTRYNNNYCFESGSQCVLDFPAPYDSNYETVPYADYELSVRVEKTYHVPYSSQIEVTSNFGVDNVTATFKNASGVNLDTVDVFIIFYKNGEAIGYRETYVETNTSQSTAFEQFNFPYDNDYETIVPDDYKIFVNHAYSYNLD